MRVRSLLAIAAVIGGLLVVSPVAQAGPDDGAGMALLSASIDTSGALLSGSGVTGSSKFGTGQYEVVFDRDVTQCVYSVTPYLIAHFVETQPKTGNAAGVYVGLMNNTPAYADGRFYLLVFCNK